MTDAQRTVFVTAAIYPSAMVHSSLLFVYNSLTLAIGILLTGLVKLKGIFSKVTAYLGVVTGILGIAAGAGSIFVSALGAIIIPASVGTTFYRLPSLQASAVGPK